LIVQHTTCDRNGTSGMSNRSLSVSSTLILSTTSSAGISKPSQWRFCKPFLSLLNCANRNFDYTAVHVAGAERIASIAAQAGVSRLVHVSHLNASATSKSKFYQTKAEGEERVKAAFPSATIIRPGTMFGYEDKLLTNMAGSPFLFVFCCILAQTIYNLVWPIWWLLNHGETKIRPVHVSFSWNSAVARIRKCVC
jgi:hypothetical protein